MDRMPSSHRAAYMAAFQLLAAGYAPPAPALAELLRDGVEALAPLGGECVALVRELAEALNQTDPTALRKEHARLFVGPFELQAPPFGSVYLDEGRQLMGESTQAVLHFYQLAGLAPAPDFKNPPDHVVAELEFMVYLLFNEERLERDNPEQAETLAALRSEFLDRHLGSWGPTFARQVTAQSTTEFYRGLGRLTECLLQQAMAAEGVCAA